MTTEAPTEALRDIVEFCDNPDGSTDSESLVAGLSRLLVPARSALAADDARREAMGIEGIAAAVAKAIDAQTKSADRYGDRDVIPVALAHDLATQYISAVNSGPQVNDGLLTACAAMLLIIKDMDDAGPPGEMWQSDELIALIESARETIARANEAKSP